MASKLELYNRAIALMGSRRISALTDNTESRLEIDAHYSDVLQFCLRKGFWKHALRYTKLDSSSNVTPDHGYTYAFQQPSDYVRKYIIASDEYYDVPVVRMQEEQAYWFADIDPLYVAYVSNHANYGLALSQWGELFAEYVAHVLAYRACPRINPDKEGFIQVNMERAEAEAKAVDAMEGPTKFLPRGGWSRARGKNSGSGSGRADRGSRSTLIG